MVRSAAPEAALSRPAGLKAGKKAGAAAIFGLAAAFALWAPVGDAFARRLDDEPAGAAVVSVAELPSQAQRTHRAILAGGPFSHDKDGAVFGNRERLLPRARRGYYREYTVETPGARDRGARRIVCGGARAAAPDACYYTSDHYASFRMILQ